MNEEIALDLMEIYFASPIAWSRIKETCKKQKPGFLLEVHHICVSVDEWIMENWPETFRIKEVEHDLRDWGHSGDNLTRKIQWVLRRLAQQGAIDIDVDPSNMEWICTVLEKPED